jgi:hypothetical protein
MTNLSDLTTAQLKSIVAIKEQIEALRGQIDSIVGGRGGGRDESSIPAPIEASEKRHMSAAARAKIAAAAKARWARIKKTKREAPKPVQKGDRRRSPAVRAKLAAAARARWKKAKAAGKTTL